MPQTNPNSRYKRIDLEGQGQLTDQAKLDTFGIRPGTDQRRTTDINLDTNTPDYGILKKGPSLLRRMFGDPISSATEQAIPGIRAAWSGRQIERPDLEGKVSSIKPMSMLNRLLYPDAAAKMGIFGGMQLNKDVIDKEGYDMNDVLVHEMTHAGQGWGGFLRKLYNPSKDENAATDAEALRKVRKNDIELRAPR